MTSFLKQPFHLLDRKQNRWLLVIVTGLFVILFMNLYQPFDVEEWFKYPNIPLFLVLSSYGLIGMVVIAISQLVLRELFNIKRVKMYGIIIWFIVELVLLTITMYFIYGNTNLSGSNQVNEIFITFRYTLLVLIIPYSGVLLYLYSTQKGERIDFLLQTEPDLVNFYDENNALHMAINLDQILFLQTADNYVSVCYQKDQVIKKELVRTTLKKLEPELDQFPIRRCHRSYMVNIKKISITLKSSQGLSLAIKDYPDENIPVSKNYKAFFIRLIKERKETFV